MKNNKIAILDSSLGILANEKFVRENINEYFDFYVDNEGSRFGNYKDLDFLLTRWDGLFKASYKQVLISDFDLAFQAYGILDEVTLGIESFIEDAKSGKNLYLSSRNFKDRLSYKGLIIKKDDLLDATLLANAVEDGIFQGNIIDKILEDLFSFDMDAYDKVYLLSSNLVLIKDQIEKKLQANNFHGQVKTSIEFLEREANNFKKSIKKSTGPKNFLITGIRPDFYIPAEDYLKTSKPLTVRSYDFGRGKENFLKTLDAIAKGLDRAIEQMGLIDARLEDENASKKSKKENRGDIFTNQK